MAYVKNFSWSYSKYKNFDTCPKRHYEVDIAKNFADSSDQLDWGNEVHAKISGAILLKAGLPASGEGRDRVTPAPLPDSMKDYQMWVDLYAAPGLPGQIYVEQKYAMKKDFTPTGWSDWGGAWVRGIADVLRIDGPVARVVDWKTGKMLHDSRQLMINSQIIFAQHPQVRRIKTEFVWLKENHIDAVTTETFDRATIHREWPPVLAQVKQMEDAARTMNYPPKPGRLCGRFCPVISCPHHGKSYRG